MMYRNHTSLPQKKRDDWKTIHSLTPFLWEYRGRVIAALSFLIFAKIANVGVPLALKEIVDALDTTTGQQLVLPLMLLLGYGALRLSSSLFNELRDSIFAKVRHGAMRKVSVRVLEHLHNLSLRFHLERKTGAITRDMDRGTRSVSSMLNYMVFSMLPIIVEVFLIAAILLGKYSIWFTVITFTTVTIYIFFTFRITAWRMKYRAIMNTNDSEANTQAVDSLINYETVKYFGNEKYELDRYDAKLEHWEEAAIKSQTSLSVLNVGQGTIIAIGVTLIMILASQGVVAGTLTMGDLVLVNAFLLQLFIPLNFLGVVYSQLQHALSDMELMFDLLDEKPEITDTPDAKPLDISEGSVRFEHVSFGYDTDRQILFDIDFEIPPGKKLAVVGPSGAGKSTLARLLFRFYDIKQGRILINEQDIHSVTQKSLRESIGIVPQDTVLFNDSILHNIAYANIKASQEDIINAAKVANIHDFIASLPKGYDTVVGERGLKLSGGEKQRVAIARAVLRNPKILVFDEATSSLDSKSEKAILQALRNVAVDHTTLVIAHRLSTVTDADQILVMEKGHIKERGTHQELLRQNGIYAHMWKLQQESQKQEELQAVQI
ncbi:MAG: ABC transporter ATP-binding protein/permease [Gammaproteobacteria bacterium]|nr:ABC transporter ATP-binding protein/permease [Gammaproteobacteria bacterium]MDH5594723.1 ABC transporter ATP-binding protein/permease [Gammaproteobacteria bacterium]MDH5613843.1 ABC transporter ATP-binding protein/permease [Gammaproteobacteria bacterium]